MTLERDARFLSFCSWAVRWVAALSLCIYTIHQRLGQVNQLVDLFKRQVSNWIRCMQSGQIEIKSTQTTTPSLAQLICRDVEFDKELMLPSAIVLSKERRLPVSQRTSSDSKSLLRRGRKVKCLGWAMTYNHFTAVEIKKKKKVLATNESKFVAVTDGSV